MQDHTLVFSSLSANINCTEGGSVCDWIEISSKRNMTPMMRAGNFPKVHTAPSAEPFIRGEDGSGRRKRHGPENLCCVRHVEESVTDSLLDRYVCPAAI